MKGINGKEKTGRIFSTIHYKSYNYTLLVHISYTTFWLKRSTISRLVERRNTYPRLLSLS